MTDFPFTTDGCSGGMTALWKLFWRRDPPWNELCVTHDKAYWAGGTARDRRAADRALMAGVTLNGHPIWAFLMWVAVRIGGHPLLWLPWRWGYGFRWPRGYDDSRVTLRGFLYAALALIGCCALLLVVAGARAHDSGQWGNSDPAIRQWYQALMQPDNPTASCCGEADAYWADEIHVRGGKTFVTITDDRPDAPLGRPHVDNGTEIEIPNHKLKFDRGNPTGHGVVFLSRQGFVFCYVQPGGA